MKPLITRNRLQKPTRCYRNCGTSKRKNKCYVTMSVVLAAVRAARTVEQHKCKFSSRVCSPYHFSQAYLCSGWTNSSMESGRSERGSSDSAYSFNQPTTC